MHVVCPGCSTRYSLPAHLLGPAGARVCCPACQLTFVLGAEGGLVAVLGRREAAVAEHDAGANGAADPPSATATTATTSAVASVAATPSVETQALAVLRVLDDPPGSLAAAATAGRLFADHGPALLDAFESLERERPGEDVAAEFRVALREVAGVELTARAGEDVPSASIGSRALLGARTPAQDPLSPQLRRGSDR